MTRERKKWYEDISIPPLIDSGPLPWSPEESRKFWAEIGKLVLPIIPDGPAVEYEYETQSIKQESKPFNAWEHVLSHECPCGIYRNDCDYHR